MDRYRGIYTGGNGGIYPMVAFIDLVRFIVYFCISFVVQNNLIDNGETPKYFTKYVVFFL